LSNNSEGENMKNCILALILAIGLTSCVQAPELEPSTPALSHGFCMECSGTLAPTPASSSPLLLTPTHTLLPTAVSSSVLSTLSPLTPAAFTAISSSWDHTCALTAGGGVECWGDNSYGELGDGTTTNRALPVDVSGLASGVSAISAGYDYACALKAAGGVKCWGNNTYGELGDGDPMTVLSRTPHFPHPPAEVPAALRITTASLLL
jgi:hypothetical protein